MFSAGAAGVQETWLPGETPAPRQPWDTGPPAALPERQVLLGWFEDPVESEVVAQLPDDLGEPGWADVADQDWETSWRAGFEPIRVTRSSIAVGVARTASARPEPATPVMTTQDTSGW